MNSLSRAEYLNPLAAVLLISLRAHGDSSGRLSRRRFQRLTRCMGRGRVLGTRRPGRPVLIMGTSMGAAAAIFAARALGQRVQGYILESPYLDLKRQRGIEPTPTCPLYSVGPLTWVYLPSDRYFTQPG